MKAFLHHGVLTCALEFEFFNKLLKEYPNDIIVNGTCVDPVQADGERFVALHTPSYPITYNPTADLPKLPLIKVAKDGGETLTFSAFNESVKASITALLSAGNNVNSKKNDKNG